MRYGILLTYLGDGFSGWQSQPKTKTVQGSLEQALGTLLGGNVAVTGAGRTDSGVSAVNYVAHFDSQVPLLDLGQMCYKLNAILPSGIVVHDILPEDGEFHARFSARSRTYKYLVHRTKDPFLDGRSWRCWYPMDIAAMNEAGKYLLGTHDFRCFEKVGGNNKTDICTVTGAEWSTWIPSHVSLLGYPCGKEDYLVFTITADRFLRNMVRAIVGTMIEIGGGKKPASWMGEVMESHDRHAAGQSVPACGLYLAKVEY